jgi:thiol-disulfide isomerase/thioredoxin
MEGKKHITGKRTRYPLIVLALACIIILFNSCASFAKGSLDFALVNIQDGQILRSADCRGKTMIVAFTSIYCKSCKQLNPILNMVLDRFQTSDCLVVIINIDQTINKEVIRKYVAKHKIRFPVLLDGHKVALMHKVFMLPTIFFIGPGGKIKKISYSSTYKSLEKELSKRGVPLKGEQRDAGSPESFL